VLARSYEAIAGHTPTLPQLQRPRSPQVFYILQLELFLFLPDWTFRGDGVVVLLTEAKMRLRITNRSLSSCSVARNSTLVYPTSFPLPRTIQKAKYSYLFGLAKASSSARSLGKNIRYSSTTPYKHVTLSRTTLPSGQGTIATVKLANPKKLNIVNSGTLAELKTAFESLHYDDTIRVVVITGEYAEGSTHAFCGGADIREMGQITSPAEARAFITRIHDVCEAIRNIPAITIARIDGVCLGAGLEIVAACDFRYATDRSRFSMPEVKIGIPSVVHARSLVNIMGWQQAKRLMAFAEILGAEESEKTGLLDKRYATTEELDQAVRSDIDVLVSHGRKGMHAQKKLFKAWEESDFHAGLRTSIDAFAESYADGGQEPRQFMSAWIKNKASSK
jgi:enoyl-CoA hydratase